MTTVADNFNASIRTDEKSGLAHWSGIFKFVTVLALLLTSATYLVISHGGIYTVLGIHRPISMLEHAGGIQLSSAHLKGHVPLPMHMGHHRYWFGPLSGFTYTTNCMTPGVLKVGYFEPALFPGEVRQASVMITAYENDSVYQSTPRPLVIDPAITLTNARGDLISYHASDLNSVVIRQIHSSEIITISYLEPQSVETMIRDSESLRPL